MQWISLKWRAALAAAGLTAFTLVGVVVIPRALEAWPWLAAQENPEQLTELGLRGALSAERVQYEAAAALDADDPDLAASFLDLARQQKISIPAELERRYAEATTAAASARRSAREFFEGARTGTSQTGAGIAGVLVTDASGIGDIRDLIREGRKLAAGEEADQLVLGLAVAGLALTTATLASLGAAAPAKAGVSTLKAAAAGGRMSKPLARELLQTVNAAVDTNAARAMATSAARLDLTAARASAAQAFKPAAFTRLQNMASDVSLIGRRTSVRGANEALGLANNTGELRKIARLAEARGGSTRAVLKVLGRGAFVVGAGIAALAGWTMAGIGYLLALVFLLLAVAKGLFRMTRWGARIMTLRR